MAKKLLGFGSNYMNSKKFLLIVTVLLIIIITIIIFYFYQLKSKKEMIKKEEIKSEEILPIRKPAVAGQFYPADKKELEELIDYFLAKVRTEGVEGEILGLILPHAGYQFSGQVAAFGFKNLIGKEIDTVILIGNSHYEQFNGVSVYPKGFFETPFGRVSIDSELANSIIKESERIFFKESAHLNEHSLEVQLPFLQKVLKNFKIVPILFGNVQKEDYQILAEAILKNIKGKNILIIASSDLSHYPSYEAAKYADNELIEAILTGEIEEVERKITQLEKKNISNAFTFACGIDAIKTLMFIEKELGANKIKLLKYANSGDILEDKSRVVGYAAIGFFGERRGNLLNKKEKERLLKIAKESVESYVLKGVVPEFKEENPFLNQKLGAFVTIKKKGKLRGCIGRFSPIDIPLYQVVSQMAVAAATQDIRFFPVQKEELKDLTYEISVLSELKEVDDWKKIEIGKHGVQILFNGRSGVFLPQVATENNLDLEEFLNLLCLEKVGAEKDCYKKKEAKLYIFTAQVFGEEEDEEI